MAEELKRHDIAFSLDLNKHPKDAINLSLINAENFKVSEDGSTLISDKTLKENTVIKDKLSEYYGDNSYNIIFCIPTNNEIVLFVISNHIENKHYDLDLFRYNEKLEVCSDSIIPSKYEKLKYYGGKFSGTFTYNVKNELIIAFCEYDSIYSDKSEIGEPLQIINLGYWDSYIDDNNNDIHNLINENNLDPRTFPLCPEVTIPKIINDKIINGFSKKGWYHFYIRYKINKHDYTQWFNFGKSFYLDEYKKQTIFSYKATSATTGLEGTEDKVWEESNYFSDEMEVCNKSIKFDLKNIDNKYKFYQIGFVCTTKSYTTCKITNDINIENELFTLDFSSCVDYDPKEIIKVYNNYYNVKNIINYNNRLYISNYNERSNEIVNQNVSVEINKNQLGSKYKILLNGEDKYININKSYILYNFLPFNYVYKWENYITDENNEPKELYKNGGFTVNNQLLNSLNNRFDEFTLVSNVSSKFIIKEFDAGNVGDVYKKANSYYIITKILLIRGNGKEEIIDVNDNIYPLDKLNELADKYWIKKYRIYGYEYDNLQQIDLNWKYTYNNSNLSPKLVSDIPFTTNKLLVSNDNTLKQYSFEIQKEYQIYSELSDTNNAFTLIPNQPYVFYINYIDKYGQVNNGNMIHLSNISNTIIYNNECYLCLGSCKFIKDTENYNIRVEVECFYKVNSFIDLNKIINAENIDELFYSDNFIFKRYAVDINGNYIPTIVTRPQDIESLKSYFNLEFFKTNIEYIINTFSNINLNNKTFGEIYSLCAYNNIEFEADESQDSNGDWYWSMFPYINYDLISYYNGEDHGILIPYENNTTVYDISFHGITIPKDYVSYFISYEKLNKTLIHQGLCEKVSDKYELYHDNLNYKDSIKLNNFFANNYHNTYVSELKYIVANDYKENNQGLSTKLQFNYNKTLNGGVHLFIDPLNINILKNKTLIRISEIEDNFSIYNLYTYGFLGNHFITKSKFPYRINAANNLIKYDSTKEKLQESPIETDQNVILYDYINHTSKQLNNSPKIFKVITNDVDFNNPTAEYYDAYMFLPQDTVDLFKNNALDFDSSVLSVYTNNADNLVNNTVFNKTIRRSSYIQDESLSIDWRRFDTENYKIIQENKGKITNIVGVGDLLLVHTEHSLFQFNKNNLLTAIDKTVQLGQQDTFDVDYKEIFSSIYGYGGLQDTESYILGEFGYIWYNNDFNKIYQYNAGSLNIISGNIEFLLNKYKPTKCKFVDDKQNKRLIIQFQLKNEQILNLTYNYDTKSFISFYINNSSDPNTLNETYNTKTKFYILENNKVFNGFDKCNAKKLSFIINENYSKIKRLNFIKYKLYKRIDSSNDEFNANSPVEGNSIAMATGITPYSGYQLRVYNDLCDTGILDIHYDVKAFTYDTGKPCYDLGNFTFNYLRDKTDNKNQIFGNYFIVEFIFEPKVDQEDGVIEFESLEYGISYEEN